ncbi:hypothetical protein [Ruegeria atlantica]|uniref:hypothetical protein n=1 Tax=Ruegeria atlantica TaxID=81569 RepID=UPI001480AE30|nr:hypothetical protein [Ruegeria atlantica]
MAASHNDFSGSAKDQLSREDKATLISLPFVLSADQMGFAFVRSFQLRSLEIRESSGPEILKALTAHFIPVGIDRFLPTRTVLEKTIYGAISVFSGAKEKEIEEIVLATLRSNGLCSKSA